ncbi:Holliday junction branch migration DNA helicase RuvB, partial [Francisella tularensis subsp. holarctica]|nr:Holliday junction branch migration DNA helicase RuvB [Francisella tularensis subsp. holarctica]
IKRTARGRIETLLAYNHLKIKNQDKLRADQQQTLSI